MTEYWWKDPWNVPDHAAERTLSPLLVLLDEAYRGAVTLTKTGRLTNRAGSSLAARIDPESLWLSPYSTLAHDHPLSLLLDVASRLKLVRAVDRHLKLRRRGRKALRSSGALWQQLVSAMPFERDEFGLEVAYYLLLLTAAGFLTSEQDALPVVDHLVGATGWYFSLESESGINSIYAASITLTLLRMAASADVAERDDIRTPVDLLATGGARLLASAVLGNQRLARRPPPPAR